MTDTQKLLQAIADDLVKEGPAATEIKLRTLVRALDGVNDYYHDDAVQAAFGIGEDDA